MLNTKKLKSIGTMRWVIIVILVALLVTGAVFYANSRRTAPGAPMSGSSATKGEPATSSKGDPGTGSTGSTSSQPGDDKGSGSTSSNAGFLSPSGDFVSNHHPNLSGSPAPNTLTSVCTTTPGTTCQITFTKDGATKSLPAQLTDRGGSAYWNNWSLQSYGLNTGSWQVKAIASLNGQTKMTTDALALEVSE